MKFGHTYQQLLASEFPLEWGPLSIAYRQLKKNIRQILWELDAAERAERGLPPPAGLLSPGSPDPDFPDVDTLAAPPEAEPEPNPKPARPPVELILEQSEARTRLESYNGRFYRALIRFLRPDRQAPEPGPAEEALAAADTFFATIFSGLRRIHAFQQARMRAVEADAAALGPAVRKVATPRFRGRVRNDLAIWREVFLVYSDSRLGKEKDSAGATAAWADFLAELDRRKVRERFRKKGSGPALDSFVKSNESMLRFVAFHELNGEAVRKILKKFDKRVQTVSRTTLPPVLNPLSTPLYGTLWSTLSSAVTTILPRLDDHLCSVCLMVYYVPLRLSCGHIFCVSCIVRLQEMHAHACPICRATMVVHRAEAADRDWHLAKLVQRYFRDEVAEKKAEDRAEKERRAAARADQARAWESAEQGRYERERESVPCAAM